MISISNLTTLCVVAACLLRNVSASLTLQNPCVMQEVEANNQNLQVQPPNMFLCELQGADSELVANGVSGSEIAVEIRPEDVLILFAQMDNFDLDGLTVFAKGLAISKYDSKLSFPPGVAIVFGNEEEEGGRRLGDRDDIHSVLVVRVLAVNTTMHSAAVLSDKVFGTDADINNLSERFRSCSYGQLLMQPTNHTIATDGVADITVNTVIIPKKTSSETVVNAVKAQLGDLVGDDDVSIKQTFRHVIMCLPKGTTLKGNPKW
jgi:hypothetical protein